ncbi:hypothetical protein JTB14_015650 [Gonioctena quinquepunctata]|nr:hypothetical protein JTB14_015650 [Gonioctena quinquepunctata]
MEKDPNNSATHSSSPINDEDAEKSFVGKFKSIINNTPLSKWFRKQEESRSTIRRRDDEAEDDEIHQMQPPSKRAKRPVSAEENNSVIFKISDSTSSLNIVEIHKEVNQFPEPVAGPSGIKSRKLLGSATISKNSVKNIYGNSDLLNGHKDSDSEESTSGYSSVARIGSKEHVCHSQESSKQASPMQNNSSNTRSLFQSTPMSRSFFADRTLSPNPNSLMTSRRPAFNASTFGSPNFIDKTITTEKIINSPFYNGRTIYGGASAYGRRLGRRVRDLRTSLKKSVEIKPVNKSNENGNLMLGKTARRILETLEQYSSPVNDAKKIPVTSKRFRPDGYISQHVGANPFLVRGNEVPSNKELQVPTVSDLLKMKQKMRLQQSTEVVRQIAISSKSDLNTETSDKSTNGSKKSKILENKIAKKQKRDTEVIKDQGTSSTPSLPTTALPKFEVVIPPEPATKRKPMKFFSTIVSPPVSVASKPKPPCETVETVKNKQTDKPSTDNGHFKFSDPLIISANLKSIVAINNFKFSVPLRDIGKSNSSKSSDNEKLAGSAQLLKSIPMDQTCLTEPQKPAAGEPVNSDGQKSFGNQFKMSTDKWECGMCMVRNENKDNKCVACTMPKPLPKSATPKPAGVGNSAATPPSFGDKFKMPSNMWGCPVCMIRNENSRTKCSACETPNTKSTPASPTLGFGTKFQGPSNTWECTSCLVRNKEDAVKCEACETPNVGKKSTADSLGSLFKKKEDEWECAVCMVRNKSSNLKCQCCEAIKPGSAPNNSLLQGDADKKPLPKFNFGIDKAVANSFSFGIPPTETKSLPKHAVDPATVFGATTKPTAQVATFSFGVASEPKESSEKVEPPKLAIEKTVSVLPTDDNSDDSPLQDTILENKESCNSPDLFVETTENHDNSDDIQQNPNIDSFVSEDSVNNQFEADIYRTIIEAESICVSNEVELGHDVPEDNSTNGFVESEIVNSNIVDENASVVNNSHAENKMADIKDNRYGVISDFLSQESKMESIESSQEIPSEEITLENIRKDAPLKEIRTVSENIQDGIEDKLEVATNTSLAELVDETSIIGKDLCCSGQEPNDAGIVDEEETEENSENIYSKSSRKRKSTEDNSTLDESAKGSNSENPTMRELSILIDNSIAFSKSSPLSSSPRKREKKSIETVVNHLREKESKHATSSPTESNWIVSPEEVSNDATTNINSPSWLGSEEIPEIHSEVVVSSDQQALIPTSVMQGIYPNEDLSTSNYTIEPETADQSPHIEQISDCGDEINPFNFLPTDEMFDLGVSRQSPSGEDSTKAVSCSATDSLEMAVKPTSSNLTTSVNDAGVAEILKDLKNLKRLSKALFSRIQTSTSSFVRHSIISSQGDKPDFLQALPTLSVNQSEAVPDNSFMRNEDLSRMERYVGYGTDMYNAVSISERVSTTITTATSNNFNKQNAEDPLNYQDISPSKISIGSMQTLDLISTQNHQSNQNNIGQISRSNSFIASDSGSGNEITDIMPVSKQAEYAQSFPPHMKITEIRVRYEENNSDHSYFFPADPVMSIAGEGMFPKSIRKASSELPSNDNPLRDFDLPDDFAEFLNKKQVSEEKDSEEKDSLTNQNDDYKLRIDNETIFQNSLEIARQSKEINKLYDLLDCDISAENADKIEPDYTSEPS